MIDAYRRNPLFRVIECGEAFHGNAGDPTTVDRNPLMAELAEQGIAEYRAVPLNAGGAYHNAATIATKQAGGLSDAQCRDLDRILSESITYAGWLNRFRFSRPGESPHPA